MPNRHQNLVGRVYHHLTVIKDDGARGKSNAVMWLCLCDCGRYTHVSTAMLNSGEIQSCGHTHLKNIQPSEKRHLSQLSDRLPKNNHTGEKNISVAYRYGKQVYRVAIMYQRHQHSGFRHTLPEAIKLREKLRHQFWPGY
ncbi:hypothetical protein DLJ48_06785 [Oenococcus sicerae]|uniref:Uncharacterized protein n=1 Tax=Oenococcus sicerae TaxID=2203724 RepID=A0ABX5QN75_9LACO|nr:hypothetical protein [Oenococcus sicerae]QAS70246.2 hypothetical protein DLJ48_06785 [Oenococcus sicerae]